ncbi:MAG: ABC transporter substrate-binding protein [Xanthobacteraceae bacterium]
MKRRELITLLCSTVAAWPLAVHAQQPKQIRRVGVLMGYAEDDPEAQFWLAAFKQRLMALGWTEGRNLRIDTFWAAGDISRAAEFAKALVTLQPEVILSNSTPVTEALHRETKEVPLVFVNVSDPIGSGFVESLPRPGGNVTGFINLESSLVEKWLELLKEIAPRVTQVAVMFNPQTAQYVEYYLKPLETAASKIDVKTFAAPVRGDPDIEAVVAGLGRDPGSGLIAMTDSFMGVHRKTVIELTGKHEIPLMYYLRDVPAKGGLISYGIDFIDQFEQAASYVDLILRGAKPVDLPVQVPTKYELVVNLKTAKALGLRVPQSILIRADEIIE